ncbi:hypothetical protein PSTG_09384 [Puccinia striiformis f. sp. tritici PST-78]|uniref:Uncharacterized protein n=1 Tax=Puccinia striiformis f. sp. tritici PST-78 TaxID=1165861 RepID=A0A0L0VDQ9_9BASI|nr:hypothetical protein PSTG_09384 [Puccinia striiformis f. sp. tritici PST-78]
MEIPPYRSHYISGKTRTINLGNMEIPAYRGNLPSNPGKLREQAPSENSSDLNTFGPLPQEIKNRTSVSQSITPARPINSGIPHFLEAEPAMPVYSGPAANSVKIKPMDKDFGFNGVNIPIEKFILRYEDAGSTDGATSRDLAKQIVSFIKLNDLKDEIEEMSGYKDGNWKELKSQLLNRFGSAQPLVKYTKHDLQNLISQISSQGGIQNLTQFKSFRTKFEAMTHYLVRMGYSFNVEEFRDYLLEALHRNLEIAVTRDLIRDNQMLASRDGGHILPDSATLMTYIQKELQSASLMERRHQLREVERQRTYSRPAPPGDKTMDDLSRQLSSWNIQKHTPFISSSHVPYKKLEKDYSAYTCHYCGAKGHSLHRCNSQTTDEIKKLCRKEGANIIMPDETHLPFDRNTPYKIAVDKWHAERKQPGIIKLPPGLHTQQMEQNIFQSSLGELEFLDYTEESGSTYDCDVGRESKNKEKVQETPSAKNIRQEQEDSMDEEQGVMDKLNLPDIDYGTPEPRKNSTLKKIQIKAPENISIKQEAPLAEESPVIIVSETLEEPLNDLSSTLNILEEIKEVQNVQENLHTYSTGFELNQSPILTTMENLEANVLSLDVTLFSSTHLAISLETCIYQKDPGRSTEKKINSAQICNYNVYPDHTSAYQLKSKHSIPPDPPRMILKPHLFYTVEVKTKNYIDHISCFRFTKQRIKSVQINNNYIESLVLPVFLPQYFNNQQKLVCLRRSSIHSIAPKKTVSKLKKARKRIRYFDDGRAFYYTPSELISQWQYDRNPSSGWQPETMQTSKQWSLPKDNSWWFDGPRRCHTTRMVNFWWLNVWRWRRMACRTRTLAKKEKDWMESRQLVRKKDGYFNLNARVFSLNVQQHKKHIGKDKHHLLSDAPRPVVGVTQKKTSNLSAYLNERPWSFSITEELSIYSNWSIAAFSSFLAFYFCLSAQSVAYERTRLSISSLLSSSYSHRGRRHHRIKCDAPTAILSFFTPAKGTAR